MGKEFLSCRNVLWILVFGGFAMNYILRVNLNIAIVKMIIPRSKVAAAVTQCSPNVVMLPDSRANLTYNFSIFTTPSSLVDNNKPTEHLHDWNEYEQGLALGAYYWLHWLSQIPGGLLTRRYGTKMIFGLGNVIPALLGLVLPVLAQYHLYGLVTIRVLQGLVSGVVWPSMHSMTAKWIPPTERSKFVSAYMGGSIGAAVAYPLCATVINYLGWEFAFYVTSLIALIWSIFWYILVYDSPNMHPRISKTEKEFILENIGTTVSIKYDSYVPWKQILTSKPLYITMIGHWGACWGLVTFMIQAPTYFNFVHGWNINATGFFSGFPHVLRMVVSYTYSMFSDWLLKTKRMKLTNVRKMAEFMTCGVGSILTLGLAFSGCEPILAVCCMMAGTGISGAYASGTLANLVDLSPNYSSVLLGCCGVFCAIAGFISPLIVGILTNHNQTVQQWRIVYIITACNLAFSAFVFITWGTSDVQPWNNAERKRKNQPAMPEELETLNIGQRNDKQRDNNH